MYKPELAEFHYGFKYLLVDGDYTEQRVFDQFTPLTEIMYLLDKDSIRVSSLTEEDILSFGFRKIYGTTSYHHSESKLQISRVVPGDLLFLTDEDQEYNYFYGKCRNADELAYILYLCK